MARARFVAIAAVAAVACTPPVKRARAPAQVEPAPRASKAPSRVPPPPIAPQVVPPAPIPPVTEPSPPAERPPPEPTPRVPDVHVDASDHVVDPSSLRDAPTGRVAYDRKQWRHWIDEDKDCQDARVEVLIEESEVPVVFADQRQCKVKSGRWTCAYTGKVTTKPGDLDIDHLVALGNAARSGGQPWSSDRKKAYANDLAHDDHLIAVDKSANRSKGDKGPEAWLPPRADYRCEYIRSWVRVKHRWKLGVSPSERKVLDREWQACSSGPRPAPLPPVVSPESSHRAPPAVTPAPTPSRSCCRVCRTGCACGDSCIPCDRQCRKPRGCAC